MSVANQLPRSTRRTDYDAVPGQTVFGPAPWLAFDPLDVVVRRRPIGSRRWADAAGVTVSLSASPAGFPTATFALAQTGYQVRVEGRRVHPRITDVTRSGSVQTAPLERELDTQSVVLQELRRDADEAASAIGDLDERTVSAEIVQEAAAIATEARDIAAGYASDAVSQGNVPIYATFDGMPAVEVPPGINALRLNGRSAAGDGGAALYRIAASDLEYDGFAASLRFTTSNGRKFVWADTVLNIGMVAGTRDAAAFQAAIDSVPAGAAVLIDVPAGEYHLDSSPSMNGRDVSWLIDPGAVFTGAGDLPIQGSASYYNGSGKSVPFHRVKGSPANPVTDNKDPVALFSKHTDFDPTVVQGINAALVALGRKYNVASHANCQGIFAEASDAVGWIMSGPISFVEGGRCHGLLEATANLGAPYGLVSSAICMPGSSFKVAAGHESEVNIYDYDQPSWLNFNPGNRLAVAFNATTGGNKRVDALYMCNPFMSLGGAAAVGFAVTNNSVWDVAFASNATLHVGLDLSQGHHDSAAIRLRNGEGIQGGNASGSDFISMISVEAGTNNVLVGPNASQIVIPPGIYVGGEINTGGRLIPVGDAAQDIGAASYRWRNIYASNNVINTSDAKLKSVRGALTAAELAAARDLELVIFQYNDAITEKGAAAARLHIGVIAQQVIAAFDNHGLDAWRYGCVGKDRVMKTVTKTRLVRRPRVETVEEKATEYVREGDAFTAVTVTHLVERYVTETLPVRGADGQIIMVSAAPDEEAPSDPAEFAARKPRLAPLMRTEPIYDELEELYQEQEASDEEIYSVRYTQILAFIMEAQRQTIAALAQDVAVLKAAAEN